MALRTLHILHGQTSHAWRQNLKIMKTANNIYHEKDELFAEYVHGPDYVSFSTDLVIKNSGKSPVSLTLKLEPPFPFVAEIPEKHTIKAKNISELVVKVSRWFNKFGYKLK